MERVKRIYWQLGVESVREKVKGNHREGGMPYVKGNMWRGNVQWFELRSSIWTSYSFF